jgi:hypothetical protein
VIPQPSIQFDRSPRLSFPDRIQVSSRDGYHVFGAAAAFWQPNRRAERQCRAPHAMRD